MNAYDILAAAVEEELAGDPAFGLIGDANMHAMSVLHGRGRSRVVGVNHEGAAVSAADGFATASGRVGFATTTCGPGLTHAGTSLVAAARNRSPVVLLAGDTARAEHDHVQRFDQTAFAAACEAEVIDVRSVDSLLVLVQRAFHRARARRGPVVLNVPLDVQLETSEWWPEYVRSRPAGGQARAVPDPAAVEAAAARIARSERPVIVAGRGAMASTSPGAVRDLAERMGALVATTLPALGWLDGDPFSIGVAGTFGSTVTQECFADADLVVAIGSSLNGYTTQSGLLFPDAGLVHVDDREPERPGRQDDHLFLAADAGAAVDALRAALPHPPRGDHRYRTAATCEHIARAREFPADAGPPVNGLDPRAAMRALGPLVPGDAAVVCGAGHFWSFPIQYLSLPASVPFFGSYTFGAIGQTLSFSIGVAAAVRRPVLAFEGDGGALMNVQELDTAVRERVPLKLFVVNDRSFGAEMQRMAVWGLDDRLARFERPSFAAVGRALGAGGADVRTVEDLPGAVRAALDHDGPFVIDVHVSDEVMSEPFRALVGGEPAYTPLVSRRR